MIRPGRLTDLDDLERLERQCFEEPWPRRLLDGELRASSRVHLIAQDHDLVTGYLMTMQILDEMHVNKIGVAPTHRRRGVAAELMRVLEAIAVDRGCTLISLEVRSRNGAAREFYRSIGFDDEYIRRRYYANGDDAVIMSKVIGPPS